MHQSVEGCDGEEVRHAHGDEAAGEGEEAVPAFSNIFGTFHQLKCRALRVL